jgi:hypothetical protein
MGGKAFVKGLEKKVAAFAAAEANDYAKSAKKDAKAFLAESGAKIDEWTALLVAGEMTKDDFEWLVQSRKDNAKMEALTQAGLGKAKIQRIVNGVLDLVVAEAFKLV